MHEPGSWRCWLQAARPAFYLIPLLNSAAGAVQGAGEGALAWPPLLLVAGAILALEFATVMTNELHDQETDRLNTRPGRFSGGSRVLVHGLLDERALRRARVLALAILVLLSLAGGLVLPAARWGVLLLLGGGCTVLSLGYSAPPLRLACRGAGEVTVAIVHGAGAYAAGLLSQGWGAPEVWLVAIPLSLAIFPSIALAAVPDRAGDSATGKRTLVVRWGAAAAALAAVAAAAVAILLLWCVSAGGLLPALLRGLATAHALALAAQAGWCFRRGWPPGPVDALIGSSLLFILWFSLWAMVR